MIDFASWGGAQWVLSFWLVLCVTLFPVFGVTQKPYKIKTTEWWGWYIGKVISAATLFAVLAWGGFWS